MKMKYKHSVVVAVAVSAILLAVIILMPHFKRAIGIRKLQAVLKENGVYKNVELLQMIKAEDYESHPDPAVENIVERWKWSLSGKVEHLRESEALFRVISQYDLLPYISVTVTYEKE